VLAPDTEELKRHELLLSVAMPSVDRLILAARRRGFGPIIDFQPLEGPVLGGVRCRRCGEVLEPRAGLLQRLHAAGHRRHPG
jgi:hypothetical protein